MELFENFHSVEANVNILLEFPEVRFPGVPCKKIWARYIAARTQGLPQWECLEELPEVAIEHQNLRVEQGGQDDLVKSATPAHLEHVE